MYVCARPAVRKAIYPGMSTLARAFVSQIVIDFVASQPNASGELGAVAHPLVDIGEET